MAINGTNGNDVLYGKANGDQINAGNGNDIVYARPGDDLVYGGNGNDGIYGGYGNDELYGGAGHDHLYGGAGHDHLYGGAGDDRLFGGAGNDVIYGGAGRDQIHLGSGADTYLAMSGVDFIFGGPDKMTDRFVFSALSGSTPKDYSRIGGFEQGYDKIDLSQFNVSSIKREGGETPAFAFSGAANEMIIWNAEDSNKTVICIDVNGDRLADFQLWLSVTQEESNLSARDFIL